MAKPNLLIVDEDTQSAQQLVSQFRAAGWTYRVEKNGLTALKLLETEHYDLVITDLVLSDIGGTELIDWCTRNRSNTPVIATTMRPEIELAVTAMKRGAVDLMIKPLSYKIIFELVEKYSKQWSSQQEKNKTVPFPSFSHNEEMSKLYRAVIDKIAQVPATVLILGETGTGKEVMANMIRHYSNRSNKPYIKVSCASLPESLLETELFGHEAGAFTGAIKQRKGRFELAHTGTIFLDEVGELPLSVQVKLLRVLQERSFERVGGEQTIKVDVRVIAASWRDLHEEVKAGRFREDLYYRLNVITIKLPPLRERVDDIEAIAKHFIERFRLQCGKAPITITAQALQALKQYRWNGNIRELENVIERAVVMASDDMITVDDLGDKLKPTSTTVESVGEMLSLKDARKHFEREFIQRVLQKCDGNVSQAAELLKIARKNLYEKIVQLEIDLSTLREDTVAA